MNGQKSAPLNLYDDATKLSRMLAEGNHRKAIGGSFDEVGQLQLRMLLREGLEPSHAVLDIGCGCLRTGVVLVPYLDPGNYFGTDISVELIDAGYDIEIASRGLQDRLPRANLVVSGDFDFAWAAPRRFDVALAQSVFTHLPLGRFKLCLQRLRVVMKPGGRLYATFFEIPPDHPRRRPFTHPPKGARTHADRDPFHFYFSDIERIAEGWSIERIDWGETRTQQLICLSLA